MSITNLDIRQSETRTLQDQLNSGAITRMDATLASINNELTAPGRLIAQATPTLVVSVNPSKVTNPNTGKNRVLPLIDNTLVSFLGGTLTFPSTSGFVTSTPGASYGITIGASQFVAVLVSLSSAGQLTLVVGTATASLATVIVPGTGSSDLPLGYVIVQSDGSGNIQNVTNAMLYQFVGGGSGGGSSFNVDTILTSSLTGDVLVSSNGNVLLA